MSMSLDALETRIAARALASPDISWTAKLLAGGPGRTAKTWMCENGAAVPRNVG